MIAAQQSPPLKAPALRLIETAERLFADHGFEEVSLLEIARQAGQGNKNAVQYHFGSKDKLLEAIFSLRLQSIEQRRQTRLAAMDAENSTSLDQWIRAFIYPVYEEVSADGRHHYARFARRMLDTPRARELWTQSPYFKTTVTIKTELAARCTQLSSAEFELRMALIAELLISALELIDRALASCDSGDPAPDEAAILETAIAMAVNEFQSPARFNSPQPG